MPIARPVLAGLALLLTISTARAAEFPAGPLTLGDLEAIALQNNPTLVQAAAAIAHSKGMAKQAGLYPNPTIGYVGELMGAGGTAGELQGAYIQQTIVTAGKLRLSRAKYNQQTCEAEIRAQIQELRVVNGVQVGFYEVLAIQRMLDLHKKMLANATESLRTHKEMENTGQANRADVLMQEVDLNRSRMALVTEQNRLEAAWAHLTALVGCPQMPPAPLAGQLELDGPPLDLPGSLDRLLQDSPELALALAHVVFDQITLRREKVQPIPDIQIQANTGHNFENPSNVAGVQVGICVPLFDRNQGTIRQVQADLAWSQAQVARVELVLRDRLAHVFSQYQTALENSHTYRKTIVPKAEEALAIQQEMYRKRRLAWPKVVEMERELLRIKSEETQALLEARKAEVTILGLLIVDGLTQPAGPTPGGHLESTPKPR